MAQFAEQLKAEISRLARREVRAELLQIKKSNAQYRSDMAELKRRVTSLESSLRRAQSAAGKTGPVTVEPSEEKLRFRATGFATLRKKLGLSAEQMGKLIGVSALTVYHWEKGQTRPRAAQLQSIAAVRKLGKREAARRLADSAVTAAE